MSRSAIEVTATQSPRQVEGWRRRPIVPTQGKRTSAKTRAAKAERLGRNEERTFFVYRSRSPPASPQADQTGVRQRKAKSNAPLHTVNAADDRTINGPTKTTPFRHSHLLWPVSGLTSDPLCLPMHSCTVAREADCMEIHALAYRCGGSTRWRRLGSQSGQRSVFPV